VRKLIISAAALLLLSCDRNPLFQRLGADYYPVASIGSQWEYDVEDGGSVIVTVIDQTVIADRTCYRVQSGADYSYWINSEGKLEHYEDHTVLFNGYEVPVLEEWVTWLDWPLAVGSTSVDSASTYAVSQGVTISHEWRRTTTVAGIGTAAGWADCYHLTQTETTIDWIQTGGFTPETSMVSRDIWLAPDVGMVLKVTPDSVLTLQSYRRGT
jgi:hypothetical protein